MINPFFLIKSHHICYIVTSLEKGGAGRTEKCNLVVPGEASSLISPPALFLVRYHISSRFIHFRPSCVLSACLQVENYFLFFSFFLCFFILLVWNMFLSSYSLTRIYVLQHKHDSDLLLLFINTRFVETCFVIYYIRGKSSFNLSYYLRSILILNQRGAMSSTSFTVLSLTEYIGKCDSDHLIRYSRNIF